MSNPDLNAATFYGQYAMIIQKIRQVNPNAYFFVVTLPTNNASFNQRSVAIRYMATIFSRVYVVDIAKYLPMYGTYPFVGAFYSNGHLNATGYEWTAYLFNTYIDWIIRNNYSDFGLSPFIPEDHEVSGTTNATSVWFAASNDGWDKMYSSVVSSGSYTAYMPDGTYRIIINRVDSGQTVTVNGADVVKNL